MRSRFCCERLTSALNVAPVVLPSVYIGMPAAQVAPLDKLSVVLVAVFAVLFLGEALSLKHWLGVIMIAGGAALLAFKG